MNRAEKSDDDDHSEGRARYNTEGSTEQRDVQEGDTINVEDNYPVDDGEELPDRKD